MRIDSVFTTTAWIYVCVAVVVLWLGVRWFERVNIYAPDRMITIIPRTFGMPFEDLWFETSDKVKLNGWYVEGKAHLPVIALFHGNAGNMSSRMEKTLILHKLGYPVFLFDYRGYGKSRGSPSELGTYRDAEAVYRLLTQERGIPPERLVLFGESLGCAVAADLAARRPARALILESAFTSTADMARVIFPRVPLHWVIRYRYDTLAKIASVKSPVLVMHSPQDDIVPYAMGRSIYDAAASPKRFVDLRGSHNDGFLASGEDYPRAIRDFLNAPAS